MARIGYVINYFPRLCVPAVLVLTESGLRVIFQVYLWRVNMGLFGNPFDFQFVDLPALLFQLSQLS